MIMILRKTKRMIQLLALVMAGAPPVFAAMTYDTTHAPISVTDPGTASSLDFSSGNTITLSAWIYPTSLPAEMTVVQKQSGSFYNYGLATVSNKSSFYYENSTSTTLHQYTTTSDVFSTNTWYHVAITYTVATGSSAHLYVNGSEATGSWTSGTGNDDALVSNDPFLIGNNPAWVQVPFLGQISDVRIYRRTLSATEISALASSRLKYFDVTGTGAVGYWPLDDFGDGVRMGSTATVIDRSGNGLSGAVNLGSGTDTGALCSGAQGATYTAWTNPANADCTSNNSRATEGTNGDQEDWYNFDFVNTGGLLSGSTINGIEVTIEASSGTASSSVTADIDLSWNGGSNFTSVKTATRSATADSTTTHGSSADTWGRTWSGSEFSNANFRLRLTKGGTAGTLFRVDTLQVRVYSSPVGPVGAAESYLSYPGGAQ